jgi:hypothetical protein
VTANYDIALHDLAIHTAITVDLRPDWHETTTVGPLAPERLPYSPPRCVLPDLDCCSTDELLDLAANVTSDSDAGRDDLYALCGSGAHVRALCNLLGTAECEHDDLRERVDNLSASVATLTKQLEVATSIDSEFRAKAQRFEQALVMTTNDLYHERNEVVRLKILLAAERARLERESQVHYDTMNRLIAKTGEACRLMRKLAEMEKSR